MDELIARLIQIVVEKLRSNPQADIAELANYLKAAVESDPALARLVTNRRIVQINQGNARAFQTLVEGGIANIGTHVHADTETLKAALEDFFQKLQAEPIKSPPLTPQEYRNRQALLTKVKNFWVKGVLEKSLYNQVRISLGLEERFDAVVNPWSMVLKTGDSSPQPLPQGTKVIDIFDQIGAGRTLLILGEPGAGKTTTLLELTCDLIARAEQDVNHLIPVVFNLSSWAVQRQKIADWLVEELKTKYDVSKEIRQDWVKKQQLLPLLDGLDEVKAEYRNDCIAALNQFKQDNGAELVVCSRIRDYEILSNRLNFQSAVYLRPLTLEQVRHYLDSAGTELIGLRELLKRDTALQELSQSPLMLNIMTLAYQGVAIEDLPRIEVVAERRKRLFDDYVQKMFKRPNRSRGSANNKVPSQQQTLFLLGSLAQKLEKEARTEFLIEDIQVDWLLNQFQIIKEEIMNGLIYGLILGLIIGLFFGLFFDPKMGVICSGAACIQHISVRLILYLNDQIPWDYTRFLDYAVERMFLQRLGMRYQFISKSFQEYCAGNLTRRQEY